MSITRVEFKYRKAHLRHDPKKNVWVGYQIDIRGTDGKRHRNTFATKSEAERFVDALKQKRTYNAAGLKSPTVETVTVSALFAKRLGRITNHQERVRAMRVFATFEGLLTYDLDVTAIRPRHFQIYINERLESGVKPETANREMTVIATAFKQASELFPAALEDYEPPRIVRPRQRRSSTRNRVITEAEKDAIINAILNGRLKHERFTRTESRKTVALMFELAWTLGLRIGEVRRLVHSDFDAKARVLRVVRWKTGNVTLMEYLPERAIEILTEAESPTENIFYHPCSAHTFESIIREGCESAGLRYGHKQIDGITFHSTRHSFTSRLIQVTDLATARSFTGHSTEDMVGYYSHASHESRQQAMAAMYGNDDKPDLTEIYNQIRDGILTLEQFKKMLE